MDKVLIVLQEILQTLAHIERQLDENKSDLNVIKEAVK